KGKYQQAVNILEEIRLKKKMLTPLQTYYLGMAKKDIHLTYYPKEFSFLKNFAGRSPILGRR
ncbi:hypothetical protein, partial [Bacillus sp. CDB3]|uniref:hypothetical protein n=1 Tax=Bacillus sp. CDB3 TaxID=360310 RepID=UPI001C4E0F7B